VEPHQHRKAVIGPLYRTSSTGHHIGITIPIAPPRLAITGGEYVWPSSLECTANRYQMFGRERRFNDFAQHIVIIALVLFPTNAMIAV